MAHPRRRESAERLARSLASLDATVAYDPQPQSKPNALRAATEAWRRWVPGATHHLVVQDDVVLSEGFVDAVRGAIEQQPEATFNVWNEWTSASGQSVRMAALAGAGWAPVADPSVVAVAVVMPTSQLPDFLQYIPHHDDDRDSGALYEFLRRSGKQALTSAPCLVQHDEPMLPSLWNRNLDQGPRRAACFAPSVDRTTIPNSDIVEYDWLPHLPKETGHATIARPTDRPGRHQAKDAFHYLAVLGHTRESISTCFYDRVFERTRDLQQLVSPAHLFHVWLTAVFMGFETARQYNREPVTESWAADQSLRTLLVGGLKRSFSVALLDRLRQVDVSWIADGVRLGAELMGTAAEQRVAASPSLRPIL